MQGKDPTKYFRNVKDLKKRLNYLKRASLTRLRSFHMMFPDLSQRKEFTQRLIAKTSLPDILNDKAYLEEIMSKKAKKSDDSLVTELRNTGSNREHTKTAADLKEKHKNLWNAMMNFEDCDKNSPNFAKSNTV